MKVVIEIQTTQIDSSSLEKETMHTIYYGDLSRKGDTSILYYLSQMSDAAEKEENYIEISAQRIQIQRVSSNLNSNMIFEEKMIFPFVYQLAFGEIFCELQTKKLEILTENEKQGQILLEYLLKMEESQETHFTVQIDYYEAIRH